MNEERERRTALGSGRTHDVSARRTIATRAATRMGAAAIIASMTWAPLGGCGDDDAEAKSDDGGPSATDGATADTGTGDGNVTLTPGFTLLTYDGETVGADESNACDGFFPATSNVRMILTAPFTGLEVRAESEADVALLIRFGASNFCGDDATGTPSVRRGSWSAGEYEIYVGTATDGTRADYTLRFLEPG